MPVQTRPLPQDLGIALSNHEMAESIRKYRQEAADAEARVLHLCGVLERRAAGDESAWSKPGAGYSPARPEAPEVAAEMLARISREGG